MVLHGHSKGLGLNLEVASNAAHTKDTEDLALGVVAQGWVGVAAPVAGAQGDHAGVEVAQCAEDQEHVCVGGGIVDSRRCVGNADVVLGAGAHIDLVVSGACVWSAYCSASSLAGVHCYDSPPPGVDNGMLGI